MCVLKAVGAGSWWAGCSSSSSSWDSRFKSEQGNQDTEECELSLHLAFKQILTRDSSRGKQALRERETCPTGFDVMCLSGVIKPTGDVFGAKERRGFIKAMLRE